MRPRGKLIVFEGTDGAGKGTHLDSFCKVLHEREVTFVRTRQPGGTSFGSRLRAGPLDEKVGLLTETLLFLADRAEHTPEIEAALRDGIWVICDRFSWSTLAYQGTRRALDAAEEGEDLDKLFERWLVAVEFLEGLEAMSRFIDSDGSRLHADFTFLFDVSVELAKERATRSENGLKHYEERGDTYFEIVRRGYQYLQKNCRDSALVDASGSIDDTWHGFMSAAERILT